MATFHRTRCAGSKTVGSADPSRWWALVILSMGVLLVVLDGTIVNVALGSIGADLDVSSTSLAWIVNPYLLSFASFLLLGGRMGDMFGPRRMFLLGVALFTLASFGCALARSLTLLIAWRVLQGAGGALISSVALALIINLFRATVERARAMGLAGFVTAGGGSVGLILGGVLTSQLGWQSIFLINIPVGACVYMVGSRILPPDRTRNASIDLDIGGCLTMTISLVLTTFSVLEANDAGWTSARTLTLFALAGGLLVLFLYIENRTSTPVVPLRIFRLHNLAVANVVGLMWAAALPACFLILALYLQSILRYSPLHVGYAFLPSSLLSAALSLGLAGRLVTRFGIKPLLIAGLLLVTSGLVLLGQSPLSADLAIDILPAMLLQSLGTGLVSTPLLLAATQDFTSVNSGLASGIINTALNIGGALGVAILVSVADAHTHQLLATGADFQTALSSGYHVSFLAGAALTFGATIFSTFLLSSSKQPSAAH